MPWFKVDDNLGFHHKAVMAGNAAMGMWVRAGSWCMQQLTDGFVPDHMIPSLGGKAQAERLVQSRLWIRGDGGYHFHEWDERQPTRESVEAERAVARERMAKRRRNNKGTFASSSGDVRANTERTSENVRPPRPDPTLGSKEPSGSADADRTAQTYVAEWLEHCPERPPGRVVSHVAKEVKGLVADGVAPNAIRAGLAAWHRKKLHPSTLASVVFEHQQSRLTVVNDSNGEPILPPPFTKDWV